jgi:hypothetical protein
MYGYYLDPTATRYLAEIAQTSRTWATAVLMTELNKISDLRIWHHQVLEHLAWGRHPDGCTCPLEEEPDVAVRVRGCAHAIRGYVEEAAMALCLDPWEWIKQHEPLDVARALLEQELLSACLDDARRSVEERRHGR